MKVLLTGAAGQLGQALQASVPAGVEVVATSRAQLDLADGDACRAAVQHHRPDWVLNAGAYTAVDKAESEPQLAWAVNAGAPQAFAEALALAGGRLLQLSTDFVFNGRQGHPYTPDQDRDPLGVYGSTKAQGEAAALQLDGAKVLRTSWVYGPVGRNFCRTMLRLHASKAAAGEPLKVVADQVGCPSSTLNLATACWAVITSSREEVELPPVLHWCDGGAASWYDVSVAVGELAMDLGLLKRAARVNSISTADYPTPATRPSYSLLDCQASRQVLQLEAQSWRAALKDVLQAIPTNP